MTCYCRFIVINNDADADDNLILLKSTLNTVSLNIKKPANFDTPRTNFEKFPNKFTFCSEQNLTFFSNFDTPQCFSNMDTFKESELPFLNFHICPLFCTAFVGTFEQLTSCPYCTKHEH